MRSDEAQGRTPLGFRVLLVAAGLYLVIRVIEGAVWVIDRLR